jgi:hypothetical protein
MGLFYKALLAAALMTPATIAISPAAAAERHYDCSKPGNANKAACKASASAASKVAPTKAATPSRTTTTAVTTKTTTRHYDCTKAGNANKAACKTAAAQTASGKSPGAVKTSTVTTSSTTDCTKWYNKMRAVCRTTTAASRPHTTVAPAPKPAPGTTLRNTASTGENNNPNGATAQCKDGTYSHASHRSGSCARHGGVAKWM